ncbi:MAG TPA: hypothetical protein VFX96_07800 [Pyrinomonadaceae bacterium]|nr:hypothetical protein [Pyrinomonadaceae bacterium]
MTLPPHKISFARLADMAEGRLDPAARAETEAHVAACARCAAQLSTLERAVGLMRADTSEDAPRDVLASTVSMFRARRAANEERPSLVRKVLAALSFDSARPAPAFGLRSTASAEASRQMLFSAGDAEIDLRLARGGEGWTIAGQVLGDCAGVGRVRVESVAGDARAETELSELCEFTLAPVPEGVYRLRLRLGDAEIEVPELDLTA